MKQEMKSNELESNFVDKWGYLATAVSSFVVSLLVIGLGVVWFFQMIQVNNIYGVMLGSQISLLIFALSLFFFQFQDVFQEFKTTVRAKDVFKSMLVAISLATVSIALLILSPNEPDLVANVDYIALTIGAVILAPIIEELGFRAGLKSILIDKGGWSSYHYVIISSSMFLFIHWVPGEFNILAMTGIGLVGVVLSIVYLRTKSIYNVIFIHMIYNAILIIVSGLV